MIILQTMLFHKNLLSKLDASQDTSRGDHLNNANIYKNILNSQLHDAKFIIQCLRNINYYIKRILNLDLENKQSIKDYQYLYDKNVLKLHYRSEINRILGGLNNRILEAKPPLNYTEGSRSIERFSTYNKKIPNSLGCTLLQDNKDSHLFIKDLSDINFIKYVKHRANYIVNNFLNNVQINIGFRNFYICWEDRISSVSYNTSVFIRILMVLLTIPMFCLYLLPGLGLTGASMIEQLVSYPQAAFLKNNFFYQTIHDLSLHHISHIPQKGYVFLPESSESRLRILQEINKHYPINDQNLFNTDIFDPNNKLEYKEYSTKFNIVPKRINGKTFFEESFGTVSEND